MIINSNITDYVSSFLFQKVYDDDGCLNLKIGDDMIYLNQATKKFLGCSIHIKNNNYILIKDDGENYILVRDGNTDGEHPITIRDNRYGNWRSGLGEQGPYTLLYYYNKQQKRITHIDIYYRFMQYTISYFDCNITTRMTRKFQKSFFKHRKNKNFYMNKLCKYDVHTAIISDTKCGFDNKFKMGEIWEDISYSEYFNSKMRFIEGLFKNADFLKNISVKTIIECENYIVHNVEYCEKMLKYLVVT